MTYSHVANLYAADAEPGLALRALCNADWRHQHPGTAARLADRLEAWPDGVLRDLLDDEPPEVKP